MERTVRTYSELIQLPTFEERLAYLRIGSKVGKETFGFDRYLNQIFYRGDLWKEVREFIILRDMGNDLAVPGLDIVGSIYVHHMNPINIDDVINFTEYLTNPDYLISTSDDTHRAIHYGDLKIPYTKYTERKPNDTCPWRKG